MRFSSTALAFTLASAVVVSAADVTVLVGDSNTLTFSPPSLNVIAGDTIHFEFRSNNHSVTQSTFAKPCQIMTTPKAGIDSGFQFTEPNATTFKSWSFTVDDISAPLWFFCAQTVPANHCQTGMVFAVNPTADKSFDAFQANAKASATNTTTPSGSAPYPGSPSAPSDNPNSTTSLVPGTPSSGSPSGPSTVPSTPSAGTSGTPTGSSAGSAASDTKNNDALRMSGNTATALAIVGLVAGIML